MIAQPAVSAPHPRRVQGQRLLLYAPGARGKVGGEPPSASTPRASLVRTRGVRTLAILTLTSMRWSGMGSMVVLSKSRPFGVKPAVPRSVLDATLRYTV